MAYSPPSAAIPPAPTSASTPAAARLSSRHLLDLQSLSVGEIRLILDQAVRFKELLQQPIKKAPSLRGKTVVSLFYENSTRTRTSFELAAKRLSADVVNFSVSTSSVHKGETLFDTVKTIEAMGADFIVIRHPASGAPHHLSRKCRSSVINAGDGIHEHPTQGLLDAFTIEQLRGRIEGLKVAIVGDILHSRVARSNIHLLTRFGAEVTLVGPRTLIPPQYEEFGVRIRHDLKEGIRGADVINILRIQLERMGKNFFPSIREYKLLYGITPERLRLASPDVWVMHPGPINRGVEISGEIADGPRSAIDLQVSHGIAVRMAVLYLLSNSSTE
jgi:aspartate carbamoyltransferase catalytic subunit